MDIIDTIADHPLFWPIVSAIIILLLTWVIERVVYGIITRLGKSDHIDLPSSSIFANIARITIWVIGISTVARFCFNYDITGLIAALGVGGIAISLGLQDTIANLFGGLQISLSRIVKPGDYFEMNGMPSRVVDITWRHTQMIDATGTVYVVPNSVMYKTTLLDAGKTGLVNVPFLIDPDSDIDAFTEEVLEAIREPLGDAIAERGATVRFKGLVLGGLSLVVVVDIKRDMLSNVLATDIIVRALDPVIKRYRTQE